MRFCHLGSRLGRPPAQHHSTVTQTWFTSYSIRNIKWTDLINHTELSIWIWSLQRTIQQHLNSNFILVNIRVNIKTWNMLRRGQLFFCSQFCEIRYQQLKNWISKTHISKPLSNWSSIKQLTTTLLLHNTLQLQRLKYF